MYADVCIALATSPRKFARANIALGDQRSFMRGLGFFVNAVSAAIVSDKLTIGLLGSGDLTEWAYWVGARNST